MISFPKPPSGTSPEAAWFRQLLDAVTRRVIASIEGFDRQETTAGLVFKRHYQTIQRPGKGAGSQFVGEIDLTGGTSYTAGEWGFVSVGDNMGEYVNIQGTDAKTNPPWVGNNFWMQAPNSSSQWM